MKGGHVDGGPAVGRNFPKQVITVLADYPELSKSPRKRVQEERLPSRKAIDSVGRIEYFSNISAMAKGTGW